LLADQPRIGDPAVFVFTTTGKTPISGYSKAKTTLDKAIAEVMAAEAKARGQDPAKVKPLPAWRFHDLRRTVGTHMEDALGIPPHIIGSVLNHAAASYKGVTAIYTRGNLIYERRRALVAWSRLLALAVEGGKLWAVVAAILRPETEADAARTDEFRRMVQADEKTWASYRAGLTRPRASNVRSMRGAA
jgi:integrase